MITIKKGKEPQEWCNHRCTPGADYEAKPELRKALLREQGYICAYCMQRISESNSRIEHLKSRHHNPKLALDYQNMVICCSGMSGDEAHCDVKKRDTPISFSPLLPQLEASISYSSHTGRIKSNNATWDTEINDVLNLNASLLCQNRKNVLEGLIQILRSKKKWNLTELKKQHQNWTNPDSGGQLRPYCGIVRSFLSKKIH